MGKPNRLKEVEEQHGELEEIIPATVNRLGSAKDAAKLFGVSDSTINKWLREHGYVLTQVYVKEGGGRQPVN
jgi:DNA invertase Pin-like site-specific DNA recombinase